MAAYRVKQQHRHNQAWRVSAAAWRKEQKRDDGENQRMSCDVAKISESSGSISKSMAPAAAYGSESVSASGRKYQHQ